MVKISKRRIYSNADIFIQSGAILAEVLRFRKRLIPGLSNRVIDDARGIKRHWVRTIAAMLSWLLDYRPASGKAETFRGPEKRVENRMRESPWTITEKMTMGTGPPWSYRKPMIALPINQNNPKTVLKRPKAWARFSLTTRSLIADLRMDSWVPTLIPQSVMPMMIAQVGPRKTSGAVK